MTTATGLLVPPHPQYQVLNLKNNTNKAKLVLFSGLLMSVISHILSPESVSLLRGVVVPGRDRSGRPDLHPPPCFHPHHPRPE